MITNLIIVAGHSVYTGKDFTKVYDDNNWYLFPFQKGEPKFYIEHIKTGCEIAKSKPESLLIFTGGQTRKQAIPRSESQGYFEIGKTLNYIDSSFTDRVTTEEFSRDSFENLLFPICRFMEFTGKYPETIDFITFGFKEKRFWLHVNAINFPVEKINFIGPNNPEDLELAFKGEQKVLQNIEADPYQTNGDLLIKRNERNPGRRQNGYVISCPELKELLEYTGTKIYSGKLPWNK